MDPAITQAIAGLIAAITTAVIMASSYWFGPAGQAKRLSRREESNTDNDQM